MSRIGKKPIYYSSSTEVSLTKNSLYIKNKNKQVLINIPTFLTVDLKEKCINLSLNETTKHSKAMFGTKRQEINNAIFGLESGFQRILTLFGVGYSLVEKENEILFSLGFSHPITYKKNPNFEYKILSKNSFSIFGHNKELFGQEIAKIKQLKKRNVYDCYGIYDNLDTRIKKEKRKK